jgi:transposase
MSTQAELVPHLTNDQLKERWESASRPEYAKRWHLLWLIQSLGLSIRKAVPLLGHTLTWGITWVRYYNEQGPDSIEAVRTRNPNPPKRKVHPPMRLIVYEAVLEPVPNEIGGGQWSSPKVVKYVKHKFGVDISDDIGLDLLHEAGLSRQTQRPRHVAASAQAQKEFKKNSSVRHRA